MYALEIDDEAATDDNGGHCILEVLRWRRVSVSRRVLHVAT